MDTDYFKDALSAKKLSQRGLAKLMDLDQAAISLMFRGKRGMTPHEAHQVSQILGVPILEVMRRAGIEVTDDVHRSPIASHVDEKGVVHAMPPGTHDVVNSPADTPLGTYAVQCRANNSTRDGWLLFVSPTQSSPDQNVDRLCCFATTRGEHLMGIIRRGYRRDAHNVILWPSDQTLTDVDLAWCSPVLWVKPN